MLVKVLAALVVILVVASAVTAMVDTNLTERSLDGQARQVAESNLRVLQEVYSERARAITVDLNNVAEVLSVSGLVEPGRRAELIAELARSAASLELDVLTLLDVNGAALSPPVIVGPLAPRLSIGSEQRGQPTLTGHLVPTEQGPYVQAVPVSVTSGASEFVLVGGYEFGDEFAYRLRRQLGDLAHVMLVASGRLVGSTLPSSPIAPPGLDERTLRLPEAPTAVPIDGTQSLVAYVPVGHSATDPGGGAMGIVLTEPVAPLTRSLGRDRVIASAILALVALMTGWLLFRALTRPLIRLATTAGRIADGDLDASFRPRGTDEIGELARALEHMRLGMQGELAVIARQAEDLQELSRRLVRARDEERHRLARDLHDGIQQQLVVLRMQLGIALEEAAVSPQRAGERFLALGDDLDATIARLREVSQELYPSILRDLGLVPALHSHLGRVPVSTRLSVFPDPLPRLGPGIEGGAYFVVSEALTNALKHSGASQLVVSLELRAGRLAIRVVDDGRGFTPERHPRRGGLRNIEDRAHSFGGDLTITSSPGEGTVVLAWFPVPNRGEEQKDGFADDEALSRRRVPGRTEQPQLGG